MAGLCYSCKYRIQYLDKGHAPRYECGCTDKAVYSCYMFQPALPLVTEPSNKDDDRPRFAGAMLSSRERFKKYADEDTMELRSVINGDNVTLYWQPKKKLKDFILDEVKFRWKLWKHKLDEKRFKKRLEKWHTMSEVKKRKLEE